MRAVLVAAVVVLAAVVAVVLRPPISHPELAHELIRMERDDHSVTQAGFFGGPPPFNVRGEDDRLDEINARRKRHSARLKEIVTQYGWPTEKMVGREGGRAALQQLNRISDRAFVAAVVPLVLRSGARSPQVARLVDVSAVAVGERQTFATQWTCRDGVPAPEVGVKDEANLDARRREFGLPSIDVEMRTMSQFGFCGVERGSPDDPVIKPHIP